MVRFEVKDGEIFETRTDLVYHTNAATAVLNQLDLHNKELREQIYGLQRVLNDINSKLGAVQHVVDIARRGELGKKP